MELIGVFQNFLARIGRMLSKFVNFPFINFRYIYTKEVLRNLLLFALFKFHHFYKSLN